MWKFGKKTTLLVGSKKNYIKNGDLHFEWLSSVNFIKEEDVFVKTIL